MTFSGGSEASYVKMKSLVVDCIDGPSPEKALQGIFDLKLR